MLPERDLAPLIWAVVPADAEVTAELIRSPAVPRYRRLGGVDTQQNFYAVKLVQNLSEEQR